MSVFDPGGQVLGRWGGHDLAAAGNFIAAHDIAVDSRGDRYVADVTQTFGVAVAAAIEAKAAAPTSGR